jgi:hypothetical protein
MNNDSKLKINEPQASVYIPNGSNDYEDEDGSEENSYEDEDNGDYSDNGEIYQSERVNNGMSYEEVEREKAKLLSKLGRLAENPNLSVRKLNSSHSYEEIKSEVYRLERDLEIIQGVQMYRHGLVFMSSMLETGATKGLGMTTLQDWSQLVSRDVNNNNYDQVLEEIYEIWGGAGLMRPEIKLMFMLGGSAYTFHLQKMIATQHFNKMNGGNFAPQGNQSSGYSSFGQRTEMKGPSEDTDEILRRLAREDVSDVSSVASEPIKTQKKRGRPKKTV